MRGSERSGLDLSLLNLKGLDLFCLNCFIEVKLR